MQNNSAQERFAPQHLIRRTNASIDIGVYDLKHSCVLMVDTFNTRCRIVN